MVDLGGYTRPGGHGVSGACGLGGPPEKTALKVKCYLNRWKGGPFNWYQ